MQYNSGADPPIGVKLRPKFRFFATLRGYYPLSGSFQRPTTNRGTPKIQGENDVQSFCFRHYPHIVCDTGLAFVGWIFLVEYWLLSPVKRFLT